MNIEPDFNVIYSEAQPDRNENETDQNIESKKKILNISILLEYFRKMNDYLDQEEEYDCKLRKIRTIIFKHSIVKKKLVPFYKFMLSRINSLNLNDIFVKNPGRLLENHRELISNLKLIKTFNELLRLLVDLTSPSEFLYLNHNFVFIILNRFDLIVRHVPNSLDTPDFINEINESDEANTNLEKLIDLNIVSFKESLIDSDMIPSIGHSLSNLIEYYKSISQTFHAQKSTHPNSTHLKHFKLLNNILFDSLVLNLALIRNLSVDKGESNYSLVVNLLLEANLEPFLFQLSNLGEINKSFLDNKKFDQRAFVCYCLLTQIMSLLFSKIAIRSVSPSSDRSDSPSISSASSGSLQQPQNSQLKYHFQLMQKKLNKFAKKFAKTDSFANIVEQMIRLLSKPVDLYVYYDLSYFLWLIKFLTKNFVLKNLKELNKENMDKKSQEEKQIKKTLINYDLFSYIIYLILENFEQLIFDSNFKNMNLLRLFKLKNIGQPNQESKQDQFKKVANTNSLKILSLSIACLHELLDFVNYYLQLLNSYTLLNGSSDQDEIADFCVFLNELLHFDELKQLFPLLMRFYCYNDHVYSNTLIKYIFLSNHLYLNTIKRCFELIRSIRSREFDRDSDLVNSDTNATKNSSTIASTSFSFKTASLNEIYSMYANTHTSYILKHVLTRFVQNEPSLNRCIIDLLDSLMCETNKHEYLFHMNFALALANIATLDNYRLLDQRTKDLVSNMLCGIKRLCKKRPYFANKILFNVNCGVEKLIEEDIGHVVKKRKKTENASATDPFLDSDSFSASKISSCSSSWSSLQSGSASSPSDASPNSKLSQLKPIESDAESIDHFEHIHSTPKISLTKELKVIVENEFLFCLRSLDAFKKNNFSSNSSKQSESSKLCHFIIKNDHLHRIFIYLVDLFESVSPNLSNEIKINSWQIYNCLLNMNFSMDEKLSYLNELNHSQLAGTHFSLGLNLNFGSYKNDFFKSNECIGLRQACSTDEFRKNLKEAYVKYLIDKLCIKSKRTRNAIFWVFSVLKNFKLFLAKKSIHLNKNGNELNQFTLASNLLSSLQYPKLNSSSLFQMKLINFYHAYNIGLPLVPFTFELQQVFHSSDFSHLLDIFGIVRTNRGFPFIPIEWLDSNKAKLNECLSLMEKCLCI